MRRSGGRRDGVDQPFAPGAEHTRAASQKARKAGIRVNAVGSARRKHGIDLFTRSHTCVSSCRWSPAAHRRRRAISRLVYLLRAARLDHGADPRRRGLGFRRRLAGLPRWHRMGQHVDHRSAARSGGGILRAAATRWNGPSEIPCPRCLASIIGLPQLDHADRDSGHCTVHGRSWRCETRLTASRPRSTSCI